MSGEESPDEATLLAALKTVSNLFCQSHAHGHYYVEIEMISVTTFKFKK